MKKKEQFNLALWERLKQNNIPHGFETRGGDMVEQLTLFNTNDNQPLLGVVNKDIESWCNNGDYSASNKEMDNDLFIVWDEEQLLLEGWLNVYPDNRNLWHITKENAEMEASKRRIACVKVSIPYTKGEGLS